MLIEVPQVTHLKIAAIVAVVGIIIGEIRP